ncbi:MAG TPA: N-6 DNA methylase [Bacteroidales bacterium]|nr:N-6 DNA methylase [Bacteroidales bacterium]HOK73775.1 N-6 DNA methylase [Bacteroidales bacterium]HRT78835.1 N-6 DNA methylase [Paludibacteraceae bacterium]
MLDNETKRRIDTARDILVGKIPDPKSQVEQITIALVYKFMDDMDKEAVELGGNPLFFTGDYERYGWSKIFDPRIGGYEMLNLYAEAITRMSQNPNLPELFRNIFKNAYLPYRDPETLKLFLKTINEFTYDHSERLGDAFEYLLSVMSSQGDAGQFRTPRHIIDFMVEIVSPQKHETILDPACGTAGFLISAYKHILRENTSPKYRNQNGTNRGDLLNSEERKKLLTNFKGYDISPDMVRLSLVNMYLHGFVQPQIMEYDTLTSEERWNEYADVILANPPFMTPKGGIKPHKRFSVQSNRSEVLFVDYIAEHLTPAGRAAVIVPEGIIFQSANAYKQLRKMLVENHLYAVVSLPAGVFNPYSGVKTSILLMDRQLAKKTDSILFVKIENDGFDLGAQRRPIDKNDLPDALNVIKDYITAVRNNTPELFIAEEKPCNALLVKKEKLAENGEYNLTGDRYRIVEKRKHQKWPMVRLMKVCEIESGSRQKGGAVSEGVYSIGGEQIAEDSSIRFDKMKYITREHFSEMRRGILRENDVLMVKDGATTGKIGFWKYSYEAAVNEHVYIFRANEYIESYFLFRILQSEKFQDLLKPYKKGIIGGVSLEIQNIQIPLPPLEVQREIVAEIEGYQKLIDGCRQVVDSWKPQIDIDPKWPMVKLGEVCELIRGITFSKKDQVEIENDNTVRIATTKAAQENGIVEKDLYYVNKKLVTDEEKLLRDKDILISTANSLNLLGRTTFVRNINYKCSFGAFMTLIRITNDKVLPEYIYYQLNSSKSKEYFLKVANTTTNISNLSHTDLKNLQIPLPPLEVQQKIVAKIEAERKVIDGCRELIKVYEEKIKQVIDKVWGE